MLTVECLKQNIASGNATYPVYVGFLAATDIALVAEAPAFTKSTAHQQIAANVSAQPVKDWQRPLDGTRIAGISGAFDDTGNLMPNPILLAQNAFVNGKISITPKQVGPGQLSGTWEVNIDDAAAVVGQHPLWILDGQHRVAGLAESKQHANPVPVVFLLDGGSGAYSSPLLASLFAQVTTSATKLDPLHNEWLTYAFDLGSYESARVNASNERLAFDTVIELCRTPMFHGLANPFLNAVQFNEHMTVTPSHGGFIYKCTELKNLVHGAYYHQPATSHLAPADVAGQIAMAYADLWSVVGSQKDTVFFSPVRKEKQGIVQDAYLTAVLARVLKHGAQTTWKTLLQSLMFHQSNWDFSWVHSLSGPSNTASKSIATSVLTDALTSGQLPKGSSNIPDHLRGNGAYATVTFSALTPKGRAKKTGQQQYEVLRGSTGTHPASQFPHMKVTDRSTNIGKLEVLDAATPGGRVQYPSLLRSGLVLQNPVPNPLELMFVMTHYGGLTSSAELRVNW